VSDTAAIDIKGVCKRYPVFGHPWQAVRYLVSLIWDGVADAKIATDGVEALTDVTLRVSKGERVGVVGRNGAGKSTLLKLLAGDFPPATGHFAISGKVYCLLPGSVSFSLEQSVEENARQYLSYLGLAIDEMNARLQDIREFTELGEYFLQPVKNLSLGMRVRAEFAVATAQSADIVIIDEVLGAGDIYWSEKIARRMERLCAEGTTLLLVSHSLSQINRYCTRAVWIERGKIVMDGPALEVTKRYEGFLERLSWQTDDVDDKSVDIENVAAEMGNETLPDTGQVVVRWPGRGDIFISGVWLNEKAVTCLQLGSSDPLSIRLRLSARRAGDHSLRYLVTFWDSHGKRIAVIENESDRIDSWRDSVEDKHDIVFRRRFVGLKPGQYFLTITVSDAMASATTTKENATRHDVLYKSFTVHVEAISITGCPQFICRLNLASE
jgi:lipopolysaccharide transport system ATP-binding protein